MEEFDNSPLPGPPSDRDNVTTTIGVMRAVICLLLSCFISAYSQQKVVFTHLTAKDGLSQSAVNCILQDHEGFMWFGTQDGLNRYDGYQFVVFKHDPSDPKTLSDNFVLSIAEDTGGTLWIKTLNNPSTLDRFDRRSWVFTRVSRDSVNLRGASINSSHPDYVEDGRKVWRGTIGGGVTVFDAATGTTKVFRHDSLNTRSLLDDKVYSIYRDHLGVIWVGTKEGLDQFDARSESFIHYRHDNSDPNSLSDNWVWPILEDRSGALWVGTFRGGLNRFDRAMRSFTHFAHDESEARSLSGDQLISLYQDRSGMIWVGVSDHGVDRFHPEFSAFERFAHSSAVASSLVDNNILSIHVDRTGVAWIGTRKGLERFDRAKASFIHFQHNPSDSRSLGDNQPQVILEDHTGALWIGMVSAGLDRYDRTSKTFTHFRSDPADPKTLSDNRVYALCEDHSGRIWVGTYGGGLNLFDPSTRLFRRFVHSDSVAGSLGARGVFALFEDREGTLWVGTFGGGLDELDRQSGSFKHFRHEDSNPQSISDDMVTCIYEDHASNLWVGTAGGLSKMDRTSGTFRQYHMKDGLPNEVLLGILEDSRGNLWISTDKGLSRFDPKAQVFRNYDFSEGLQGDEFNQNAYSKDPRTGEMYFGGSNGFNVFSPYRVKDNEYVPPVVFSAFTRYNTDDKEGKPIEEKGIDAKSIVTLSYKDNVANFEFAALSFYNNAKNLYAYRLEGYNDNWIQLGSERKATFTNLDAGSYVLHVKGSNNDGIWNESGAALNLIVTPPWWRTRWAYAGYVTMVFGFFYTIRRFEINRREQKVRIRESELRAKAMEAEKRALEAENERQTKELEDARNLQLSMLPKEIPQLPLYDISVFMKTATEVGGDYYDFSMGQDGALNVAFGDATGHGMQAGTIVTLMKGLFLSDASRFDIQTFFNHCSRAIKQIRLGRLFMAFTLVKLKGNCVSLSSAGMPPAYLYRRKDGSIEEILLKGMPLGAMKEFPYALHQSSMEPGDTLLLLTDGLPEQKNARQEMFDYARVQRTFLEAVAESPERIIHRLVRESETWMDGVTLDDDITLLVIKMKDHD